MDVHEYRLCYLQPIDTEGAGHEVNICRLRLFLLSNLKGWVTKISHINAQTEVTLIAVSSEKCSFTSLLICIRTIKVQKAKSQLEVMCPQSMFQFLYTVKTRVCKRRFWRSSYISHTLVENFRFGVFLQCHSHVCISSRLHSAHLFPLLILTFAGPVITQPKAVCVQGNLGPRTKLGWLFLSWADAPTRVAAAAKYVMFFCSAPKHASSELIDSTIILNGTEGWGLTHTRDQAGPWVRRCAL